MDEKFTTEDTEEHRRNNLCPKGKKTLLCDPLCPLWFIQRIKKQVFYRATRTRFGEVSRGDAEAQRKSKKLFVVSAPLREGFFIELFRLCRKLGFSFFE